MRHSVWELLVLVRRAVSGNTEVSSDGEGDTATRLSSDPHRRPCQDSLLADQEFYTKEKPQTVTSIELELGLKSKEKNGRGNLQELNTFFDAKPWY